MYLSITACVCMWLSGFIACLAGEHGRSGDRDLAGLARWCSGGLLLSAVIFLVIAFTVGCASSRTGKALNIGVVSAGTADVVSTRYAMQRGAVEANPVMGQSLSQQVIVKAVGVGTLLALTQLIEVKHPRIAHVVRGIVIVGWSAVSVHNVQVGR